MKHIQKIDVARRAALKREADAWAAHSRYCGLIAALKARRADLSVDRLHGEGSA